MFAFVPTFVPTGVCYAAPTYEQLQLQEEQTRVRESSKKHAAWFWGDEDEAPVKLSETLLREKGLTLSETASTAASTDHDTATTCSDDAPLLAEDYEVEKTFVTVRPASGARKRESSCPAKIEVAKEKTVMWRNLPCTRECDRDFLHSKLKGFDFFPSISFFNLVMDYRNRRNCGYAFVVFSDSDAAAKFSEKETQRQLARMLGTKQLLQVNDATLKGLHANIQKMRTDAVMDMVEKWWRPLLSKNAADYALALPPPTTPLRKVAAAKGKRGKR